MALIAFPHHPCSYALEYLDYFTLKFVYELVIWIFSVFMLKWNPCLRTAVERKLFLLQFCTQPDFTFSGKTINTNLGCCGFLRGNIFCFSEYTTIPRNYFLIFKNASCVYFNHTPQHGDCCVCAFSFTYWKGLHASAGKRPGNNVPKHTEFIF